MPTMQTPTNHVGAPLGAAPQHRAVVHHPVFGSKVAALSLLALGLLAPISSAEVITVGASQDADHSTLQQALDQAGGNGTSDQIRIQQGTLPTRASKILADGGDLTIEGGWNATFTARADDPTATILDGEQLGQVLSLRILGAGVVLLIDNLTVTGGAAEDEGGGGVRVLSEDANDVLVVHVHFMDNQTLAVDAQFALAIGGGGLSIFSGGALEVEDSVFFGNRALGSANVSGTGGGAALGALGSLSFRRNHLDLNVCSGGRGTGGCALHVSAPGAATIADNVVVATVANSTFAVLGLAGRVDCGGALTMERNRWLGGRSFGSGVGGSLVRLSGGAGCGVTQRSSVIADSQGQELVGLFVSVLEGGSWRGSNLTIVDHPDLGLEVNGAATASLHNSILYGNGTDAPLVEHVVLDSGANLIGVDPHFAAPQMHLYQLSAGSPAFDSGMNAPPGGLGSFDVERADRIQGATVDAGAYEGPSFVAADGFDSGTLDGWSASSDPE